tara:strand:+ start:580 stop:744 length:165 start_codon:yes stop_codon:yes gene_type:complete
MSAPVAICLDEFEFGWPPRKHIWKRARFGALGISPKWALTCSGRECHAQIVAAA